MMCICLCLQLDKDELSDEESEPERGEDDKGDGEEEDEEKEYCWERSKDGLNAKLKMLTNSCVLNNLTNHRAAVVRKIRNAQ